MARLSADIGHLFVEGDSDARVLTHLLGYPSAIDIHRASEVQPDGREGHPFWGGYKLRLIELAENASKSGTAPNICCLIDADFGALVRYAKLLTHLHETEYANFPVATLTYEWLRTLLLKAYGYLLDEQKWIFIQDALRFAFLTRFVAGAATPPTKAANVGKFVALKAKQLAFNRAGYASASLSIKGVKAEKIVRELDSFGPLLNADIRFIANSNDTFDVIFAMVRLAGKAAASSSRESLRQAFLGAMDDDLVLSGVSSVITWAQPYL